MYTVQQITALTPTHISVLLSDDVAYDVDRGAFEEYVAPNGVYEYNVPVLHAIHTGDAPYETAAMTLDQYWEEYKSNDTPHIADLNDYISQSKSTQLDIDVVRAKHNLLDTISHYDIDRSKLHEDIDSYATAIKNQITYQNQ